MQVDDPAYLPVGTEISAKFKGAFCEAKVKKLSKAIKFKIALKDPPFGSIQLEDESQVKGEVAMGVVVEVLPPAAGLKAPAKGTIVGVKDSSLYTVLFNDGDERILRRTQICLKGAKHFALNLDAMPLTSPEQFGTPVSTTSKPSSSISATSSKSSKNHKKVGKGNKSEPSEEEDSGEESDVEEGRKTETQFSIGSVVLIKEDGNGSGSNIPEVLQKKKVFPALVVSQQAQKGLKVKKNEMLVRSFKDGKYLSLPRSALMEFTLLKKQELHCQSKASLEKAVQFVEKNELPPHWDRALLLESEPVGEELSGAEEVEESSSDCDSKAAAEGDRFVAQLYKYHEEKGTPINKAPVLGGRDLNLFKFYKAVQRLGGFRRVCNTAAWKDVIKKMQIDGLPGVTSATIKNCYSRYLLYFDSFYRQHMWSMDDDSLRPSRPARGTRVSDKGLKSTLVPQKVAKVAAKTEPSNKDAKPEDQRPVRPSSTSSSSSAHSSKTKFPVRKAIPPYAGEERPSSVPSSFSSDSGRKTKVSTSESEAGKKAEDKRIKRLGRPPTYKESSEEDDGDHPPPREEGKNTEDDPPPANEDEEEVGKFFIGQKIMAHYCNGPGKQWFEAKILQIDPPGQTKQPKRFFIHYLGWKGRYDEWVLASKIQAIDPSAAATTATSSKPRRDKSQEPKARKRSESGSNKEQTKKTTEQPKRKKGSAVRKLELAREKAEKPGSDSSSGSEDEDSGMEEARTQRKRRLSAAQRTSEVKSDEDAKQRKLAESGSDSDEGEEQQRPMTRGARRLVSSSSNTTATPKAIQALKAAESSKDERPHSAPVINMEHLLVANSSSEATAPDSQLGEQSSSSPPSNEEEVGDSPKEEEEELDEDEEDLLLSEGGQTPNYEADGGSRSPSVVMTSPSLGRGPRTWKRRRRRNYSQMVTERKKNPITRTPKKDSNDSDQEENGRRENMTSPRDNLHALKLKIQLEMDQNPGLVESRFNFTEIDPTLDSDRRISVMQERLEEIRELYHRIKGDLSELERKFRRSQERKRRREEEERQKAMEAEVIGMLISAASTSTTNPHNSDSQTAEVPPHK